MGQGCGVAVGGCGEGFVDEWDGAGVDVVDGGVEAVAELVFDLSTVEWVRPVDRRLKASIPFDAGEPMMRG